MSVTILIPVYNDWDACAILLRELDRELGSCGRSASVLLVDDGSSEAPEESRLSRRLLDTALTAAEILHLRHNLGHQRAIAIGLAFLENRAEADVVVVMDGDGEDLPSDVNRLLDALAQRPQHIVFAERRRRSEGLIFTALYNLYRWLHLLLTGESVRVGNFSAVPRSQLQRLVAVSDLWNNYSAAVFHARLPTTMVPTQRGARFAGHSKMNFVGLVVHGLSAMSVYGDRIGVRLLFAAGLTTAAALAAALAWSLTRLAGGGAVDAWGLGLGALLLLVLIFVMVATALSFVFVILAGRGSGGFLPFREFPSYVSHVSVLADTGATATSATGT